MISLNKAFFEVYVEYLKDRGYRRVKGKYPYLVRRVGDEIIHVMTVIPTFSVEFGRKAYYIFGGIGTVYRTKLPLDENPKFSTGWLVSTANAYGRNFDIPVGVEFAELPQDIQDSLDLVEIRYSYEKTDENSLLESMRRSADQAEIGLLQNMEGVDTLKKCAEWYRKYSGSELLVLTPERYRERIEVNDSLLNFILYTPEEYAEIRRNMFIKYCKSIEKGKALTTNERFKEMSDGMIADAETRMKESIARFTEMATVPENQEWIKQELERRKKDNAAFLIHNLG